MEIFKFNIKPEQDIRREIFIQSENNCPLCGTELEFSHQHTSNTVIEKAHCPSCSIKLKVKEHTVH